MIYTKNVEKIKTWAALHSLLLEIRINPHFADPIGKSEAFGFSDQNSDQKSSIIHCRLLFLPDIFFFHRFPKSSDLYVYIFGFFTREPSMISQGRDRPFGRTPRNLYMQLLKGLSW